MTETQQVQPPPRTCPSCGEAPMTRMQHYSVLGTRSKCRRCGAALRIHLERSTILLLMGAAMVAGALIATIADTRPAALAWLGLAAVLALVLEEWTFRALSWVPDETGVAEAQPADETVPR